MTHRRARGALPIAVLVGLAAVPLVLIGGVWQYAEAKTPPPTTTTTTTLPPEPRKRLSTDLLSFRRHPMPLAEVVADDASAAELAEAVGGLTAAIGSASCVQIAQNETVIVTTDPAVSVIPASNQKLFVAAVALELLGSDYTFRTELQSVAPVLGAIVGDVFLVGGGDPVLRTADVPDPLPYPAINTTALELLADQLVVLGITTIDGNLVGDGGRYDDEFRAPSWPDEISNFDAGPYDALLVNDGLISNDNYGLNPSRSAARVFLDLVLARGIVVTGSAGNFARPTDANLTTLALVNSKPLTEILVEMLHTSDNNTAEMLVKEIGFVATGQGTRQAGLDTIRATLERWGVPVGGLQLSDGSGLSRENRTTCVTLAALLNAIPVAGQLKALLPVAGRDGTLGGQFVGTPAEGVLAAKTGTLTGVKALTGEQPARVGAPVTFSVVLNGDHVDDDLVYRPVWNELIELIDSFPFVVAPAVDRFEPK